MGQWHELPKLDSRGDLWDRKWKSDGWTQDGTSLDIPSYPREEIFLSRAVMSPRPSELESVKEKVESTNPWSGKCQGSRVQEVKDEPRVKGSHFEGLSEGSTFPTFELWVIYGSLSFMSQRLILQQHGDVA
jgi:hypothetical protein